MSVSSNHEFQWRDIAMEDDAKMMRLIMIKHLLTTLLLWSVICTCHGFSLLTIAKPVRPKVETPLTMLPPTLDDEEIERFHTSSTSSVRRRVLNGLVATTVAPLVSFPCLASGNDDESKSVVVLVKGTVSLPPGMIQDESPYDSSSSAALYITCRPNRPDNVPQAILQGTRGKPPPVLAARFEHPTSFPFAFQLTSNDVTLEGSSANIENIETKGVSRYWWSRDDLIVSARLDSDGVASTRSPEDLVGRGIYTCCNGNDASIELQGRGAFGKFATRKGTTS